MNLLEASAMCPDAWGACAGCSAASSMPCATLRNVFAVLLAGCAGWLENRAGWLENFLGLPSDCAELLDVCATLRDDFAALLANCAALRGDRAGRRNRGDGRWHAFDPRRCMSCKCLAMIFGIVNDVQVDVAAAWTGWAEVGFACGGGEVCRVTLR